MLAPLGSSAYLSRDVGVGVDADGGNVEFAARGALVQRLDVLQNVLEAEAVRGNQILRQRVKHEGVIGSGEWPSVNVVCSIRED